MLPGQIDGVRRVSVDNRGCTGHRAACRRGPRVGEDAWNGFILIFEKSFHSEKMLVKQKNKNMKFNTNVYFLDSFGKKLTIFAAQLPKMLGDLAGKLDVDLKIKHLSKKLKKKKKTNIILVTLIVDGRGGHEFVILLLLQFVRVEFQRRHHGGRVFLLVRLTEQFILIKNILRKSIKRVLIKKVFFYLKIIQSNLMSLSRISIQDWGKPLNFLPS